MSGSANLFGHQVLFTLIKQAYIHLISRLSSGQSADYVAYIHQPLELQ